MKFLLFFLLSITPVVSVPAAESLFYVSSIVPSTGKGIYLGGIDTETGKLRPLTLATAATEPNFLVLSSNRKFLYGCHDTTVVSLTVKPDGTLTALNEQPTGGEGACHVALAHAGRHLLVANYSSGTIACFGINADGSIEQRTAMSTFTGSGPDPKRQTKPYAHWISTDAADKFVYSCDLGSDKVWIFHFDPAHGTLTPSDPPFAQVPPGSGPRHLAFSAKGDFAYVANEMGNSVTAFSRDAVRGTLTALGTISDLPAGTSTQGSTTAEIVHHPSGKWLYVSIRGCELISVFVISADGHLKLIQSLPSVAQFPRSFAVDPSGRWLISAGQKGNRLAVFKIDQTTGQLTTTDQSAEIENPTCVLFVGN